MSARKGWVIFAFGNAVPFYQDFGSFRGVPGGCYFEPQKMRPNLDDGSLALRAPGFGMLGHPDIEGHSLYGSGAIVVRSADLAAALADGSAKEWPE